MVYLVRFLYNTLKDFDAAHYDKCNEEYLLMGHPWKIITIIGFYIYFVKFWGPQFMKDRAPFELRNVLLVYNLLQVAMNLLLVIKGTKLLFGDTVLSDWGCFRYDTRHTPTGELVKSLGYGYYQLKVLDFFDTIFFVLRKRQKQITFLHFYHHLIMALLAYMYLRYTGAAGQVFMLGYVNSIVHAVMYFYYFISAQNPQLRNSIWWKRYITQMQMAQFMFLIVNFARPLFRSDCDQHPGVMVFGILQNLFMLLMFGDFYIKEYIKKPRARLQAQQREKQKAQ